MSGNESLDQRRRRRELAKQLHPDAGGSAEAFTKALAELSEPRPARSLIVVFKKPTLAKRLTKQFLKRIRRCRHRSYIDLN